MERWELVRSFVKPVRTLIGNTSGDVDSEYGNCIVASHDRWVLSAQHVISPIGAEIKGRWFGFADVDCEEPFTGANDFAIAKLENYDAQKVQHYPVFGNIEDLQQGTSLYYCGSRFPPEIDLSNLPEDERGFAVYPGRFEVHPTSFLESFFNRHTTVPEMSGHFLATTGAIPQGLSGGALVDDNGRVYGVLSGSDNPSNVGLSVDIRVIRQAMDNLEIDYQSGE